jgi:hypothetical protein
VSAIRGPRARLLREVQHDESERREEGLPIMSPPTGFDMFLMDRYAHTESIGPTGGGKTPGGRLKWRADGPSLFVVKP